MQGEKAPRKWDVCPVGGCLCVSNMRVKGLFRDCCQVYGA